MNDQSRMKAKKRARLRAAINLEPHDRVPVVGLADFWPVSYSEKYTMQDAFYNVDTAGACFKEAFSRWNDWDAFSANLLCLGPLIDAAGSRRWTVPGRDISPDADFQHPDITLMDAGEYPRLIDDPMTFITDTIIPRLCRNLAPDDYARQARAWAKVALYTVQLNIKRKYYAEFWEQEYGIPPLFQGAAVYTPVDLIADQFRGFREGLLDIKIRPETVQAACEALVPFMLGFGVGAAQAGGDFPLIFNPQHTSPFISPKDYDKVYWPTFKKLFFDGFVALGYKVWAFFEGNQEHHLKRLQDLPKGRMVAHFESTDLRKAKEYLGGHVCIAGGMPVTMLAKGSPREVRERTISILKIFENEPGFIMTADSSIPGHAKPENIDAWLTAVREFGRAGGNPSGYRDEDGCGTKSAAAPEIHCIDPAAGAITCWDDIRPEAGAIKGDEKIIKEKWEELEKLSLSVLYALVR